MLLDDFFSACSWAVAAERCGDPDARSSHDRLAAVFLFRTVFGKDLPTRAWR